MNLLYRYALAAFECYIILRDSGSVDHELEVGLHAHPP